MIKQRKLSPSYLHLFVIGLLCALFALSIQQWAVDQVDATASAQMQRALKNAARSGRYQYQTELLQTLHPTMRLENVGRTTRSTRLVMAGEMDRRNENMHFQLSMANQPPLEVKIEAGAAFGRLSADQPWTQVPLATDLFAPGGDPLAFLATAQNIRVITPAQPAPEPDASGELANSDTTAPPAVAIEEGNNNFFPNELLPTSLTASITRYQFELDGLKYAQLMRREMESYLREQGELPAGITLGLADRYVKMQGQGEIWVSRDANGNELPMRQMLRLSFPPAAGATDWVEAEIVTTYAAWQGQLANEVTLDWRQPATILASALHMSGITPQAAQQMGFTFSFFLIALGLLALSLTYRHALPTRVTVYALVVLSMVATPLLQTQQVSAFYDAQAKRRHQVDEIQASNAAGLAMATQPLNAHTNPMAQPQPAVESVQLADMQLTARSAQLVSPCVITASSDCDGDGLTDNVEIYELGTDIEKIDTDGDGISDGREVKPFQWFGTWYLDPLKADTNGDGLDDGEECFVRVDFDGTNLVATDDVPCLDRDMDEVPDVFDFDNDGDGVPDAVDISPNDAQVVEDNQIFKLDLVGAQTEKNLLVDLQLRPIDDSHLSWTNSILDWREKDDQGQIQRMTPNTLGNGAGDIQLMPMLEITIPYSPTNPAGGLPAAGTPTITATTPISTWLDTSLTAPYAINVWLGKDGARNVAVPLMLVTDPTGGAPVAWQARMPYRLQSGITEWGAAHEMRVVWYVQGQVDSCTPPTGAAADYCTKTENWVSGKTVLQTYPESFRIIGLSITEQHDTTAFLAGQAISGNSPVYADQLWHLADVLQQTWLRGASVNGTRFPLTDVAATLGAWGISGLSTRTLANLGDEIALLKAVNMETARTFIETDLYPTDPAAGKTTTVLLAGEESARSAFLGGVEQVDSNTLVKRTSFANTVLTVDLTGAAVTTQAILRWQPYRFDGASWQTADLSNYITQLETALTSVFTQAKLQEYGLLDGADPSDSLADVQAGAVFLAQNFYMATMAGVNTVAGSGSVPGPGSAPLDNSLYATLGDPALAIVQAMTGKVQHVYTVLNRTGLDVPTVDANIESKAVTAWQRLSQSTAAVLAAYGQVASGASSSAISQALAEMSKSAQISLESNDFVHLYDGGLIFATAATQAGVSGGLADAISPIWTVGSPVLATYSHLWYAQMAGMTQLRSALMISSAGRQVLGNIQQLETTVAALKTKIGQLSTDLAQAAPSSLTESASSFAYKQKARANMNFYIRDARFAENIVAAELGFEIKDGEWFQQNPLYQQYKALNNDLASTKLSRDLLIGDLNAEKARLQRSFGVSLDQVAPEAALKIKRTAAKWGLIGVATSAATAGLTIVATLANGTLEPDSPAFAQLLAAQVSSVIVDAFVAVLDVLVVVANFARLGTALAFLAVLDLIVAVVCVATNLDDKDPTLASWICGGFTGAIAKALSLVIGDVTPLADLANPNRLQMQVYPPALGNESGVDGIVAGNSITFSGTVTNTLYLGNPSWKSEFWRGQWSDDNLDDATFAYQFQAREQNIPLGLNGTTWQPYPGRRDDLYVNDPRFLAQIPIQSLKHSFGQPGSNQSVPMSLAEGFAVRQQSCWLITVTYFCWLTKYDDTVHIPMDNSFVFDVLPNTIDGFRTLLAQSNRAGEPGYRLAWDDTFPILADADNDGLRSQAKGGIDPDDNNPDTDADGLSDAFEELNAGFDPLNSDSDCDGLTDYWEAFYGTDPSRPDSDGDGLTDNEEHFHPNQLYPYESSDLENYRAPTCSAAASYYTGGWSIVYDYDSSGNPLITWVNADPLDADSDDDTLNDKQERIYAFNPNVASDLNVLSLYSTIESSSGALPYVAPSGSISYTAVITNELTLPYVRGLLEAELPLDSVRRNQPTGAIAPRRAATLTGNIALAEAGLTASGATQMGVRAGAIIEDPTGRSLWLHFNEPVGSTTFVDSSFLGNDATCVGAACPAANGSALTFDGNDSVTIPHSAAVDLAQFTVALWVKPTAGSVSSINLLDKRGADGANYQLTLRSDTNYVQFATSPCTIGGGDVLSSPTGLPLNQWSHVAATYDGATKRLYVNGVLVNSTSYTGGVCRNANPVFIGRQVAGFIPFTGQMDEIEIYPLALDQGTVSARYGAPALQVDLRNGVTWGSSAVSCSGSRCPSAGGDGAAFRQEHFLSATAPDLSGDAFAFAMWIKPQPRRAPMNPEVAAAYGKDVNSDWQGVFGNMVYNSQPSWPQASTIYPSLFVSSDGALRMMMGDGASTCQLTTNAANVVQQNRWQFLVVSYDGSNFTFYVDGRAVDGGLSGQSCAGVTPPTVANFFIGRPNDYGYPWLDRLELVDPTFGQINPSLNLNSDAGAGNIWKTIAPGPGAYNIKKSFHIGDATPNQWIRLYQDDRGDGGFDALPNVSSNVPDTSLVQITGLNSFNNLGLSGHPFNRQISGNNFGQAAGTLYFGVFNDYFQGSLDQFQVYPFALDAERVTSLYNSVAVALDLPFDEAPGADLFADASGNFASVACSGSTCPVSGVPGRRNQAVQFDGVDDYLILGSSTADLGFSSSDFSVMMWVKPDDFLGTGGLGLVPLMEIGYGAYIGLLNGRLTVQGAVLAQDKDTLYNATGRWYHLAYVYDRRAARYTLYVNGRAIWQQSYGVLDAVDSLQIGRWTTISGSNYYFDGLMDDLTVLKRALSQAEVQAHFNRAPAVNLHLDEDLSRTTFVDDSNNRFAATCANTDTCPDAADKGQMREAVTFDGNDTLTLSATAAMTLTNFSVGMWVKPTKSVNAVQWLATKADANFYNANFRLSIQPNGMTVRFERQSACAAGDSNWHRVDASSPLLEDQWNHVVATHSAADGIMAIYINGSLSGTVTGIGGSACTATNAMRLGQAFNGGMDEVAVYKTVLNAGQVADTYQYQAAWFDVIDRHDLYVDADIPTVDLSRTPAYVGTTQTVLTVRADDASSPLTAVEYRVDGGAWQAATPGNGTAATSGAWLFNFQAAAGAHTLDARATDSVGNRSAIASATVTVDGGAPSVGVNSPTAVLRVTDSLVISGTAGDSASGLAPNAVSVRLVDHSGADVTGAQVATLDVNAAWQATQPFDTRPYGIYTATATAGDEAGNASTASAIYNLDSLPPFADVTDGGHFYSPVNTKTIMGVVGDTPYPAGGRTLHLHFETGSGIWEDGSPTGYTMQCSGATCPSTGVPGKEGLAVTFDGADDLLDFGGIASGPVNTGAITTTAGQLGLADGSFTVMAWVNDANWNGSRALLGTAPADGLFVGIQNGSPFLGYGGDDTTMAGAIPTGQWVHLAWRYNAATGERAFFVNGVLGAAATAGHLPYSGEDPVQVGRARGDNAFAGSVDELVIYDQPLLDETIYAIANPLDVAVSSLAYRVRSYAKRDMGQYEGTWTPVTLNSPGASFSTWQVTLPSLAPDAYKLDLRVTDGVGNTQFLAGAWDFAVRAPDLAVSKHGNATLAGLGDTVGFTIHYTNTGVVPATHVVITETVPVDAAFDPTQSHPDWVCAPDNASGSTCTFAVGDVAAGAGGVVAYAVTVGNAWSAGTTAIVNTVAIGADGGENAPVDNRATAQVPADAAIDLAVALDDGGASFQYTTEGSTAVVYTMTYTNTGVQPALPRLTVDWTQGGNRDPFDPDTGWVCITDPYTLQGANTCTRDVGTLGIGQSGSVTFTLYTGYFLPDSMLITTTVQISDTAGANEINLANNADSAQTPIQSDYAVVLDLPVVSVPEGSVATNGGLLLTPPYDPNFPPLFALYPAPSVGTYTGRDDTNLTWTWAYTSTDGPDQSQIVVWNVAVGEGAFTLKPSFVMSITNVPPTVAITVPDTVAVGEVFEVGFGELIDPGQDTMIDCILDWGDGTSDYCYNVFDVAGRTLAHKYGPNYVNPTLTVNVEDEDGIFVAASKTLTVTGVTVSLGADQSSVSGDESEVLTNTGTYSPLDATLSWSASEGTITDEGNGIWSWSLPAGSAEGSRTVMINGGAQQTSFSITVNGDGAASDLEDGAPNSGDGNDDGIPDRAQMNVASLPSPLTGAYVTIAVDPSLSLSNVSFPATPIAGADTLPDDASFPLGFPTFNVTGMGAGGRVQVTLRLANSSNINSYYKYDATNGWFNFMYDETSATGAELLSDRINLYFVDGARGDADSSANGTIADPGGPAKLARSYALKVNVSGNGSVSVPSGIYTEGTELNLQVTEAPGWRFAGWSGALSGTLISQTLTMDQDKTVTALFVRTEYALAVRVVGNGTVARTPVRGAYFYGDSVALAAAADLGWSFAGWSGDLGGNNTNESVTIGSSKIVTATFTQNLYTVNASSSGGGSVVLSPQLSDYRYGDVVAVEAVPDPGYVFQSWSGVSGDGRGLILVVDGNKAFTANFGPASYTISTTVSGNGAITLNPDKESYAYGEVVQVTATPDAEWSFAEWGLGLSGNVASQSLTVTDNTNVQAIFAPTTYALNVAWIGNGTAQKLTDKTAFTAGEVVTVTATPGAGAVNFAGWRNEESDTFFSTALTTTVTITGDRNIVAIFGVPLYPLTVNIVGNGTVTPTNGLYALGGTVTLTATAASGWSFAEWSGAVISTSNPLSLTIGASTVVTATFVEDAVTDYYSLTVNVEGSGVVTPTSGSYISGTVALITATPDVGWSFTGWSGDLSGLENPASLTIDGNKIITATFQALPALTLSTGATTVQYSDGIEPITLTITDVDSAGADLSLAEISWSSDAVTPTNGLPLDLNLSNPISNGLTIPGVVTYTLSGFVNQPAGTYTITLTPQDEFMVGEPAKVVMEVLPEETMFRFRSNRRAVQVPVPGTNASGPFELAIDIKERYPDNGAAVLPGDLTRTNVSLQLVPIGPGSTVAPVTDSCTTEFHDVDYDERLTFTCGFDAVPINTYAVVVTVDGGYYDGYGEDVVTIYDPSLGFTNGGGTFDWPGSTDETSFGFSIEYNKNGKNVKGRLLVTRRLDDGSVYYMKSNALDALTLGAEPGYSWATFSGKTTYQAPGMESPEGNYTFIAYVEDRGESGDRFWLQVKDKDGNIVADLSLDAEAASNAVFITNGNIVVPGNGNGAADILLNEPEAPLPDDAAAQDPAMPDTENLPFSIYLPLINKQPQAVQGRATNHVSPAESVYRMLLPLIEHH